ncbi:MAG: LysR family transcriptional regulator [Myxococcota bacterium]
MDIQSLRQLDLNLLLALHVLLEERSVTGAAGRIGVGQPAMSTSLGRLRSVLADPLLVRSGNQMHLTPRARALAEPVRLALEAVEATFAPSARFDPARSSRKLLVRMSEDEAHLLLRPLLRELTRRAPGIVLHVEDFSAGHSRSFETGETDLWVVPGYRAHRRYRSKRLFRDDWCLVGCREYFTSTSERPDFDLETTGLINVVPNPEGYPSPSIFEHEAFRKVARIVVEVPSRVQAASIVVGTPFVFPSPRRLASAFVTEMPLSILKYDLADVPRPFTPPKLDFVMQWNRTHEMDPAHAWFREVLVGIAGSMASPGDS